MAPERVALSSCVVRCSGAKASVVQSWVLSAVQRDGAERRAADRSESVANKCCCVFVRVGCCGGVSTYRAASRQVTRILASSRGRRM